MKRVVSVFFVFIFGLFACIVSLWSVMLRKADEVSSLQGTVTVEVGYARGNICDRNGEPFVNCAYDTLAVLSPSEGIEEKLKDATAAEDYIFAVKKLSKGLPVAVRVKSPISHVGAVNVRVPVRYSGEYLIPHIGGYCDSQNIGVSGIERSFEELLCERKLTVTYEVDAFGKVLSGAGRKIYDEGIDSKRGVVLTLDKRMQETVRNIMKTSGIKQGAAVLLDVKSGEILAMVSLPEYDIDDIGKSLDGEGAPFVNRALTAVSVGSVYKSVVAAAALENGVSENFLYECTGNTTQSSVTFHCHKRSGHGELDMKDALLNSCNTWFINMAKTVDAEKITELSYYMGFGTETELSKGLYSAKGIVPDVQELDSDAARANLAFGQGKLTATPLQIASMTAVFANKGIYSEPKLILSVIDENGNEEKTKKSFSQRVISEKTAEKLREMLVYCCQETEKMKFKDCGGKTATAENGAYIDGVEQFNTWYSGFFPANEPKYALAVFCENGNSGASDCMPVFERIAKEILSENR